MSHACEHHTPPPAAIHNLPRYRKVLWAALISNGAMFLVELFSGWQSGSLSLLADSVDFAGDALNYGVSLAVLSAALAWRARAAVVKALCMMGFGLLVLGRAAWSLHAGTPPDATTMGVIGALALTVNVAVAWMLYAFREGDANMRSVWLCSRNDAIGNILVMLAALGVSRTGSAWPDVLVATGMAALALQGGWQVMRQARRELAGEASAPSSCGAHNHHGHSH